VLRNTEDKLRIVINGSFDVIHLGHLRLLSYAKTHVNSFVYVLIDSDRRIKELKGSNRPYNNEYERSTLLFSLKYVDRVDIFDSEDELRDLIKTYQPDLMIKGSDYKDKTVIGSEYCKEIKFYDRLEKYSSTKKIQDIIDRG
jgi:D-beta-D-heptose 7-phosphate kinase/D-beta-D-heptose 1-phosphate adenosyltransferase